MKNSEDDNIKGLSEALLEGGGQEYRTYKSRWLMLLIFCMLSSTNAMMWITFAPISDDTSDYFNGDIVILINPSALS